MIFRLFFLLTFFQINCFGQVNEIDSLNDLAWTNRYSEIEQSINWSEKAKEIALKKNDSLRLADTYRKLGVFEFLRNEYDSSISLLINSLIISEDIKYWENYAKASVNIGNVYIDLERFKNAFEYYNQAKYVSTKHNLDLYPVLANNIGVTYENIEDYDKAIEFYKSGINHSSKEGLNYHNLLLNLGSAYYYHGFSDSAFYYTELAQKEFEKSNDKNGLLKSHLNKAIFLEEDEKFERAIDSYQNAFEYAQITNDVNSQFYISEGLMLCYSAVGKMDSAYAYLNISSQLRDSLVEQRTSKTIQELEVKYEVEKTESELEQEKLSNKLSQRTIWVLSIGVVSLILIIGSMLLFLRQRRRSNALKIELKNKEVEELLLQQEISVFEAERNGTESERKRIADDLHDRVGALLATINLQLEGAESDLEKRNENIKSLVNESIKEVRSISHNLVNSNIDEYGLKSSVENLSQSILSTKKVRFDVFFDHYEVQLSNQSEREVYKVILELVSNSLKHSRADLITLQVTSSRDKFQLMYEDNGKGFDVKKIQHGIGLNSISRRVESIGGRLIIDSRLGAGATIIVEIP